MQRSAQDLQIHPQSLDQAPALSGHDVPAGRSPGSRRARSLGARARHAPADDLPLVALARSLLNPCMVVVTLLASVHVHRELLSGYYVVLAVLAFFISSQVFDDIDLYRSWRKTLLWEDGRRVLAGWLLVVAILVLFGRATNLGQEFSERVLIWWFVATLVSLLLPHGVPGSFCTASASREPSRAAWSSWAPMILAGSSPPRSTKTPTCAYRFADFSMIVRPNGSANSARTIAWPTQGRAGIRPSQRHQPALHFAAHGGAAAHQSVARRPA